ncbi:hypothetical protein Taro_010341 [Colocasia esculenta]|uniref:glycerophosphodiester phosphodiesterase n=1 Tax=Colocasia esculenta TaxID=4460 RepID=A0A843U3C0_COLES|nr:hypothetical protein [Colocasia esculenta]
MALKAVHVSKVPRLDQVPARLASVASCLPGTGSEGAAASAAPAKFLVIGHRGRGMNALASPDRRMRAVKENSVLSFNEAGRFPVDFVEFDVQVTEDGCPVIFHDNYILAEEIGIISEKRVTELRLEEFLSYGPQRDIKKIGKSLHRKTKDGGMFSWKVENDDPLCTLEEVFQKVDPKLGFNIELKFDDHVVYKEEELTRSLQLILKVVYEFANDRPIIFSSFQPDAAQLVRKLQNAYPVFFLTNGGNEVFSDERRNSLDEAIKHCLAHGLQGIVSEVRSIFRNPSLVPTIKESNLGLLTYGQLNNVAEAVCMQHLMGIDGVIVDLVQEITEVVSDFSRPAVDAGDGICEREGNREQAKQSSSKPTFSQGELSFLLRLVPESV